MCVYILYGLFATHKKCYTFFLAATPYNLKMQPISAAISYTSSYIRACNTLLCYSANFPLFARILF